MLNVLFWNLHRNALEDLIETCVVENDIDVAIFSEFDVVDIDKIEEHLGKMYKHIFEIQNNKKVTLIAKNTLYVSIVQPGERFNIYSVKTGVKDYLLVAIHLEDRRNYKTADRVETIRHLVADIKKTEELLKCTNTIVIGDFNANPYDEELLSKYSFNAVLFKSVINKCDFTNPRSKKIKRFYNPIINFLSEDTEMYGSFYYDQDYNTSYWHCLDQVLVRKDLVDSVRHLEYIKRIDTNNLLKNSIPNSEISDHLPLLVKLEEVGNGV